MSAAAGAVPPVSAGGWEARLRLRYGPRAGRTVPVSRSHRGPLVVQRPFHPEGPVCHQYLLHPPGGLVGGDRLHLQATVESGARVLLTTPAATKCYRSAGPEAVQIQHLTVAPGASLEWLPQDQIAFDGARLRLLTRVELAGDARFFGWEVLGLGRRAGNAPFVRGRVHQRLELRRDGRALLLEGIDATAGSPALAAPWGWGGRTITGTLVATPVTGAELEAAREVAAQAPARGAAVLGCTLVEGCLVVRALADEARTVLAAFEALWARLRPPLLGRPACRPRIWNT